MATKEKLKQIKLELGRHIQKVRKEKGYTQEKLAEETGMALTSLAYIEAGYNFPAFETLYKLSEILEVPVKDLIPF